MADLAVRSAALHQRSEGMVRFETSPDQTWTLDADYLYRELDRLKPIGRHFARRIWLVDLCCDLLLLASLPSAFFLTWWCFAPPLALACLLRIGNRHAVGRLAVEAARSSTQTFLYLYNTGALWLDCPTNPSSARERHPQ